MYSLGCLGLLGGITCAPRTTPIKVDIFSALCSIGVGVARVVVPSLSALRGERPEENQRSTFGETALHKAKANDEMRKKIIKIIKSDLLHRLLLVSTNK